MSIIPLAGSDHPTFSSLSGDPVVWDFPCATPCDRLALNAFPVKRPGNTCFLTVSKGEMIGAGTNDIVLTFTLKAHK